MDSKDLRELMESYSAVYDEELRNELEYTSIDEDLSFIDDLSDNELDEVMENIFLSGEIDINECFDSLDYVLTEAKVTSSDDRPSGSAKVTTSAQRPSRVKSTAQRKQQVRVGRIAQAAKRVGQQLASPARGKSGTSVSTRVGQAGNKIASATQKVKGFLGKVGSAVKAGASAAKKEFTGQSAREANARTTGRQMRRAARNQAAASSAKNTSEFKKPAVGTSANPRIGQPAKERPALPVAKTKTVSVDRRKEAAAKLATAAAGSGPSGTTQQGQPAGTFKSKRSREQARKREARLTAAESLYLLDLVIADLIKEGYANDIDHAFDLIENMDIDQTYSLVQSHLTEEVETIDLYDVVIEHLLDEGYADTESAAVAIMANMSEEWRDEIVEAKYGTKAGRHELAMKRVTGEEIGKSGPGTGFKNVVNKAKKAGARNPEAVAAAAMYKTYG